MGDYESTADGLLWLHQEAPRTIIFNTEEVVPLGWRAYVRGAMQTFDLRGRTHRYYYLSPTAHGADVDAVQNDWQAVNEDLGAAVEETLR